MKLSRPRAEIFVPDGASPARAFARTTHLCIAAHQDDIEIMAYHGIAACFHRRGRGFSGVTVTDGARSPRSGPYARYSDRRMAAVRSEEQRTAAMVGRYSVQVQLDHPTSSVRQHDNADVRDDLEKLLAAMQPQVVYLHQPADKHDTHVATLAHALAALRSVPPARRPRQVWGCEVWRGLDWVDEDARHALDVSAHAHLAASLVGVFDSQIAGGKRYDLATAGRRLANATFHEPRAPDRCGGVTWAVDLLPLLREPELTLAAYTDRLLKRFVADVNQRVRRYEAPR